MKKNIFWMILAYFIFVFIPSSLSAETIEKGTISIGGKSSTSYTIRNFEENENARTFNFLIQGGYFIANNFELGIGFSFIKIDAVSALDSYGIVPTAAYHFPLSQRVNLYAGLGLGWQKTNVNSGSEDAFSYGVNAGCEVFFNTNVAITIGASYWRFDWNFEGHTVDEDTEDRFIIPEIGIKVYF